MKRVFSWIVIISMLVGVYTPASVSADIEGYKNLMTLNIKIGEVGNIGMTDPETKKPLSITWTSSDPSIATVDAAGNVTPKKVGTVYMLTTWNGKKYSAKVIISAADKKNTKKTSKKKVIRLNKTSKKIKKGKKVKLKLINAKAKKVKWYSSNTSVAKVSKKGVVKGRKKGTAIISAVYKGKAYSCKVKVTAKKKAKKKKKMTASKAYNKLRSYVMKNGKYTSAGNYYTVSWKKSDIQYQCNYWKDQDVFSFTGKFAKGNPSLDITMSIDRGSAFKAMFYYNMNDVSTRYDMLLEMNKKDMVIENDLNFVFSSGKKKDDRTMKMNANATFQWMFPEFNTYIKKKAGVTMKQLGFKRWA